MRPFSLNYEGPILWACAQLADFHNIYGQSSLTTPPFVVTIYPPLYLAMGAVAIKLFGITYAPLRALSMIAAVLAAVFMYRLMRQLGAGLASAMTACIFFFSFTVALTMSMEARTDMVALAFSIAMFERFAFAADRQDLETSGFKPWLSVIVLSVLSILTKQQAIVFIVATWLYLLQAGAWRLAFKLAGIWLAIVITAALLLQSISGGFLSHITYLAALKSSSQVLFANLNQLGADWLKLCLALLLAPLGVLACGKVDGLKRLPLILLAVAAALLFYSMGIPASSINHILSTVFALAVWLGVSLERMPAGAGIFSLLICLTGLPQLSEFCLAEPRLAPYMKQSAQALSRYDWKDKPVLTDDPYMNFLTGSQPAMEDCATFLNVWSAQGSGGQELINALNARRYAAVIINTDDSRSGGGSQWWPKSVVAAIKRNYHQVEELHLSGWFTDLYLAGSASDR
jgi:hypothetical protein